MTTNVTRSPNGLTDRPETHPFGDLPVLDLCKHYEFFDDFHWLQERTLPDGRDGWIITTGGTGQTAVKVREAVGGAVQIEVEDVDDFAGLKGPENPLNLGITTWFAARVAYDSPAGWPGVRARLGIWPTLLNPLQLLQIELLNGCWFEFNDGQLDLVYYKNDVKVVTISDVADPTEFEQGEFWSLEYEFNPVNKEIIAGTNGKSLAAVSLPDNVVFDQPCTLGFIVECDIAQGGIRRYPLDYLYGSHERSATTRVVLP